MKEDKLNLVGPSFEDLSQDEMKASQGTGDIEAQTITMSSLLCVATATIVTHK